MRHKIKQKKFGRKKDQRKALLNGLAANLILKEKITTTELKAKQLRPYVEKLITKGKKPSLANTRYLSSLLPDKARKKLIKQIGPQFNNRKGGYTRIVKKGARLGDAAKMAIIEFVK